MHLRHWIYFSRYTVNNKFSFQISHNLINHMIANKLLILLLFVGGLSFSHNYRAITKTYDILQTRALFWDILALFVRGTRKSLQILFNIFHKTEDDRKSACLYGYKLFDKLVIL